MSKCPINKDALTEIESKTGKVMRKHLREKDPVQTKSRMQELITNVAENYELADSKLIAETICNTAEFYGIKQSMLDYFTVNNINNLLTASAYDIQQINSLETSSEQLTDLPQIRRRKDVSRRFEDEAFGLAKEFRTNFENTANEQIVDCLFVNRGSIDLPLGLVKNNTQLNEYIRQYQTQLLKNIVNYFQEIYKESGGLKITKTLQKIFDNPRMYNNKHKYTRVLETLNPLITLYLKPLMGQTDMLRNLYETSKNDKTSKLRFDAFKSLLLLENFDTYLAAYLGKDILIKDFGLYTGEDKYQIATRSTNMATTWRTGDTFFVENEVSNIVKLLINTTPLYKWGQNTPKEGYYLNFNHFQHIIGKIRHLVFSPELAKITFDKDFKKLYPNIYNNLPIDVQGKTLDYLINISNRNPIKYWHHIFSILSNNDFKKDHSLLYNQFTADELDKLYSISKGIFNGSNSIKELTSDSSDSEFNYYEYITQTASSIYNTTYLQYYKDEHGKIQLRTLLDQSINNIRRKIEQTINISNGSMLIKNWESYAKSLNLNIKHNISGNLESITITIPNTDLKLRIFPSSGRIQYNRELTKEDTPKLYNFIDSKLPLNLEDNNELLNNIQEVFGQNYDIRKPLLEFASRIVLNQYVNTTFEDVTLESKQAIIDKIYGEKAPDYNWVLDELGMIHPNDINTLYRISRAKANLEGLTTASQVQDSEGNGLGNQTLSRLLGSFHSQWDLQEKREDSISNHFIILNNPGLIDEVYNTKEFYDPSNKSKAFTEMTVSEMSASQIIYDFIGGLMSKSGITGNGRILILPSVNSDKPNIGRLGVNLNTPIKEIISGEIKPLKSFDYQELKALIHQELGTFYTKMYKRIQSDLWILDKFIQEQGIQLPSLAQDFQNDFDSFNQAFLQVNTGYKTPVSFIKAMCLQYNKLHRANPLELVDQIHFKDVKGNLGTNRTILGQIEKFKPYSEFGRVFWAKKEAEVLKSLLKAEFKINTTQSDQEEINFIRNKFPNWIDLSGNLILACIHLPDAEGNLITQNITSVTDLNRLNISLEDLSSFYDSIELNPILKQYNLYDYLISQEYMICTVGSFVAHPDKSRSFDLLEQEASQFNAQHKRNNAFTAAVHPFQLNMINGVSEIYNVAVIEDVYDIQGTIDGSNNRIKPYDGATFVHPAVVLLENNSLCGEKVGITKKQFVHAKNERTGSGFMLKTAGFGITNDWIRNSPYIEHLNQKMMDNMWLNENGGQFITDITKNYNGVKIQYKPFYFKQNGKLYQITNIKNIGNNVYQRTVQEVSIDGNPIGDEITEKNTVVDTNYKLWNLFGGKNSMELKNRKLVPSNTSVENLVIAMNSIGIAKSQNIQTQDDLYQPLKMSDIHYVATAGAVKMGAANINSNKKFELNNSEALDFQRIKMYQAGIQLDKTHHVDESELSLLTQVVTACASQGYTFDKAEQIYQALRRSTDIKSKEHWEAVKEVFNTNDSKDSLEKLQSVVISSILKAIATSNSDSFVKTIANDLIERAKNGENINFNEINIPLSDNAIYRKVFSTISSLLTKCGIKQAMNGTLSVLTPSFNMMKLYGDKKYEAYDDPKKELDELQAKQKPLTQVSQVELGRYYFITKKINTTVESLDDGKITSAEVADTERKLINTPQDYKELKKLFDAGKIVSIVEDVKSGRNLAGYNVRFNTDFGSFQLWDLDSTSALFDLQEIKKNWKGSEEDIFKLSNLVKEYYNFSPDITFENADNQLEKLEKTIRKQVQSDLRVLSKETPNIIEQYQEFIKGLKDDDEWSDNYARWVNIALNRADGPVIKINGESVWVTAENFNDVHKKVLHLLQNSQKVRINKKFHTVDSDSLQVQPYEVIMSKVFATKFGLSEFDDLNTIKNDPDYFVKQYIKNQASKVLPNQFSVEFKRSDGNHIYVLDKTDLPGSQLTKLNGICTYVDTDGKVYRTDSNDNILYEIGPEDEIFVDNLGNDVIVTSNIQHYVDSLSYSGVNLSKTNHKTVEKVYDCLKESTNKLANSFAKYLSQDGEMAASILTYNDIFNAITLDNYENYPDIVKSCREKHTSFLRSLDVVAARIPAQCMQSFMPMKVVAFENADINTAYVSTYQLLLQGSDYDIDCVSLATFDIDENGLYQLWSPYADITSPEMRKASETLPQPTGKKIDIVETDNLDKALNLFNTYGDLLNIKPVQVYDKEIKNWKPSENKVNISLNVNTPELLKKFGNFLREIKEINVPSSKIKQKFIQSIISKFRPQSEEQFQDIFQKLKGIVDKHNTYFDKIDERKLEHIVQNQIMFGIYETISDPSNLMESQASMDGIVTPLKEESNKSLEAQDAKNRTAGNFVNKCEGIVENQTGKKGVGICAAGLKGFFNLMQYYNQVLNNGSQDEQEMLRFKIPHTIKRKTYHLLTGIRAVNLKNLKGSWILGDLARTSNDKNAALTLSALLSLAVDNAKELDLAKLNASQNTLGLYLYGTIIGVDFKDLAEILMSPTGKIMTSLLDGNIFNSDRSVPLGSVLSYKKKIPYFLIEKYNINNDKNGSTLKFNPLEKLAKELDERYDEKEDADEIDVINAFCQDEFFNTKRKIAKLDSLRIKTESIESELFNSLLDTVSHYIENISQMDEDTVEDIATLAMGAKELRRLTDILSINQGIKTEQDKYIRQINLIERCIYDETGIAEDIIDLYKFAFDESYRDTQIDKYEEIKHSFNILAVISKVPHLMGYIQTLASDQREKMLSFKYRSIKNMTLSASSFLRIRDERKIVQGLENYIGDYLRKEWMLQNEIQLIIPKGNCGFNEDGEKVLLTQDTPIQLGTSIGDATFKLFMETQVIPDLKKGKIRPGVDFAGVRNNKFIRDLINDLNTRTISGNPTVVYALPINMLPRNDFDKSILNQYRGEFNKLENYAYQYEISRFDSDGTEQTGVSQPIPLVDLFTYYTMIAFNWKQSESSLFSILEHFQNRGTIKQFHDFESTYDKSGETLSMEDVHIRDIIPYLAQKGNPYTDYSKYIWKKHPSSRKYTLMYRLSNREIEETPEDDYGHKIGLQGKYTYVPSVDTNYFPTGNVQESTRTIDFSYVGKNKELHSNFITYDIVSKKIIDVTHNGSHIDFSDVSMYNLLHKVNGIQKVNIELLQQMLNNKLNPC